MDNYIFKQANTTDVDKVLKLIQKRIKWMEEHNINQWKDNYFKSYPKEYFEEKVFKGQLFVMTVEVSDYIIGAVTLSEEDSYWDDNTQSCYIHNLVSDIEASGIGTKIIAFSEKVATESGVNIIRLDCQASNDKLNSYYYKLGFQLVGTVKDGDYIGNKREKKLNF